MQLRIPVAWNVGMLAMLLAGCLGSVDSGEYEVIVDQPETTTQETVDSATGDAAAPASEDTAAVSGAPDGAAAGDTAATSTDTTTSEQAVTASGDAGKRPAETASGSQTAENADTPDKAGQPEASVDAAATTAQAGDGTAPSPNDGSGDSGKPAAPVKREIKLLIPEKTFKVEGPEKAIRVSFDDFDLLKVLNMEPVTEDAPKLMPDWLKELDGKRVRVRGFMYPPFEETGIRGFTLARDNQICCFGRNPLVYDLVDIFMRDGETTDYIQNRPFDVVGVFHVGDSIIPGQLYMMDDAVVIDR